MVHRAKNQPEESGTLFSCHTNKLFAISGSKGGSMFDHTVFMARAIKLSRESTLQGGGPFGAVVVKDAQIIGEGMNSVVPHNDPTAHAEITAIRNACSALSTFDLSGSVIYTSCEPCPMCLGAIWWARIEKIYYANTRENAASIGFDDAEIYVEMTRSIDKRKIPMIKLNDGKAADVFTAWSKNLSKTPY